MAYTIKPGKAQFRTQINQRKRLFVLPNGYCLRYRLYPEATTRTTPDKFVRTYDCNFAHIRIKTKWRMLKIGAWTSRSNIVTLIADFDKMPDDFESWKGFRNYLNYKYQDKAFIMPSASNKAKMIFVVKLPWGIKNMNQKIALDTLRDLLDVELFDLCDKSIGALRETFIKPVWVDKLSDWLKGAPIHDAIGEKKEHNYRILLDKVHHFEKIFPKNKFAERYWRNFIGLLLGNGKLLNGFDLPVTKISKQLGCSKTTVHRMIRILIEKKLITCIDSRYAKNWKAKTYKSLGKLRKILIGIYDKVRNKVDPESGEILAYLPNSIVTGHWESIIWKYSKYFIHRPREFIEQGMRMRGISYFGRWRKLFRALNARRTYLGMSTLDIPSSYGEALRSIKSGIVYA